MGCTTSRECNKDSLGEKQHIKNGFDAKIEKEDDTVSELTEKEIRIIRTTWLYMTDDLSGNGLQIFLKIFDLCPDTKTIFNVENTRQSELAKNEVIKAHGARFMNAINAAIYCLGDDKEQKETIRAFLLKLGRQHKNTSKFKAEYFEVFHEALMWRSQICMGECFTREVSETWKRVFDYMLERIKQGYNS